MEKRMQILVIDDNIQDLNFMKSVLDYEYEPIITADMSIAFSEIDKGSLSSIIMDYDFGSNEDGLDIINRIRSKNENIPINIFSNKNLDKNILTKFRENNIRFLSKNQTLNESLIFDFIQGQNSIFEKNDENLIDEEKFLSNNKSILVPSQEIITDLTIVNKHLLKEISKNPEQIHRLTHRQFEELIAQIWEYNGFHVQLTPQTRDGGKDIIAYRKDISGELLYAIECKYNNQNNKVGRPVLQNLYGVIESEKFTGGCVATTSYFSRDAHKFRESVKHRLILHNIDNINNFLKNYS